MFGWSSRSTERLKSKLFGNGTILESAKIQTLGFQTFTVFNYYLISGLESKDWSVESRLGCSDEQDKP